MDTLKKILGATALIVVVLSLSLSRQTLAGTSSIAALQIELAAHLKSDTHRDEAVITALELQELAHSQNDLATEIYALKSLGSTYTWLGAYEEAMLSYESAVAIYNSSLGMELLGQLYFAMSSLLVEMGRYEEGLELIASADAIAQKTGDELMLAILEVNRASILSTIDKSFAAVHALEHASTYFQSVGNEHHYGRARNDIGMIHKDRGEYEAALTEFQAILELTIRTDDIHLRVYALLELGDINRIIGQYENARGFLDQALSLSKKAGDTDWAHFAHSYMAELDQETGNMEGAARQLKEVLRLERRKFNEQDRRTKDEDTTLILLDLDHFKKINDQHGHDHGDAVLVHVSRCLESKLRDADMVARWGGEEFLLLLKQTSIEQGKSVADNLRQSIAGTSPEFCGVQHQVTATLGVVSYCGGTTFTEALRHADEALYRGKLAGRNRVEIATA